MRGISAIAAAAVSLALAFGAQAGEDKIQMMDANKDGMISAAEHTAGARQMFQKMDADGDGRVTVAEVEAGAARRTRSSAKAIIASDREAGSRGHVQPNGRQRRRKLNAAEMQAGHQKIMGEQPR